MHKNNKLIFFVFVLIILAVGYIYFSESSAPTGFVAKNIVVSGCYKGSVPNLRGGISAIAHTPAYKGVMSNFVSDASQKWISAVYNEVDNYGMLKANSGKHKIYAKKYSELNKKVQTTEWFVVKDREINPNLEFTVITKANGKNTNNLNRDIGILSLGYSYGGPYVLINNIERKITAEYCFNNNDIFGSGNTFENIKIKINLAEGDKISKQVYVCTAGSTTDSCQEITSDKKKDFYLVKQGTNTYIASNKIKITKELLKSLLTWITPIEKICTSSEPIPNLLKKGWVKVDSKEYFDECKPNPDFPKSNELYLHEKSCGPHGWLKNTIYPCEKGCVDGAYIK